MINVFLFILIVLIWGTTGIAIKLQTGYGADEISILYRTGLAALLMMIWCRLKKLDMRFEIQDHFYLFGLGLCMFSLHYLFFYKAVGYAISGVIVLVFSSVSFLSIINNYIFFRIKPTFNICVGAIMGLLGLSFFFWDEISSVVTQSNTIKGFILAAIGTVIFSLGGSISKRNNHRGLATIPSAAIGMVYGTIVMFIYTFAQSSPFIFPQSISYWGSLFYLAIASSIVAFLSYLHLIKNIGPEKAGYATVVFPVLALAVSSLFEGYEWSSKDLICLSLIILGNVLILRKKSLIGAFDPKILMSFRCRLRGTEDPASSR